MEENGEICSKCHDTFKVVEKDGSVHTCWDCLTAGRMDAHSKNVKDSGVQI